MPWSIPSRRLGAGPALAISALLLAGCGKRETPPNVVAPPSVAVATAEVRRLVDWDEYTGRFEATRRVEVRARVSGYLTGVHFRDGQVVREGELLFTIDPRPYEAAVRAAEGQVAEARAAIALSERQSAQALALADHGFVSRAVIDTRQAELEGARARLLTAEAALAQARLNLGFCRVYAPIAGRIDRHAVSVGNLISGGEAGTTLLTTIAAYDPIHFYFDVDQNAYLRYARAASTGERPTSRDAPNPVELALTDEQGFPHRGHMDFVANELDRRTGTLRGRALFDNGQMLFSPGVFGRLRLVGSGPYDALLIPDAAIAIDQSQRVVYVVGADNVAWQRAVELGRLVGTMRIVRSGLERGERIVVDGLGRVRSGQPVAPTETPPRATAAAAPRTGP